VNIFGGVYRDRKVLVTGHTGFKGSWLTLWLKELGADVLGYALEPPTNPSLFDTLGLEERITHVVGDIRDEARLLAVFKDFQPEFVFHLAAQPLVRLSYREPRLTYEINVIGTVNVFESVRKTDSVRVVVNVTSDKCYENREWVYGYRETDRLGGYDPYSSSKGCAELVTSAYRNSYFNPEHYGKTHNVALASVRAGNVIGGGDWGEDRLIPDCIKALYEKRPIVIRYPDSTRPWQHVLDPLYGYLLLGWYLYRCGAALGEAWNFGPNDDDVKPVSWIAERMTEMWTNGGGWVVDGRSHPHEAYYLKLDCSKTKSKLGWHPKWNLAQSLEKTVEWYRAFFNDDDIVSLTIDQINSHVNTVTDVGGMTKG